MKGVKTKESGKFVPSILTFKVETVCLAKEHFSVLNLPVSAQNGGTHSFPHVISPTQHQLLNSNRYLRHFSCIL